jgi:hypothetical protein
VPVGVTLTCTFTTPLTIGITTQSALILQPQGLVVPPAYTVTSLTTAGFTLTFGAPPPPGLSFYYVVVE